MKKDSSKGDKGFIEIILLAILALAGLKYFFDFSIFEFFGSEEGKGTIFYIKEILLWMKNAVISVWNYIQ